MALGGVIHGELMASLDKLYTTGERSDVTIVAGKDYHVHSSIVCGRSEPLMLACKQDPDTAPDEDKGLPKVTLYLSGDDPYAVDCMVQYFYRLCYTLPLSTFADTDGAATSIADHRHPSNCVLVVHARVYAIAEKYKVQGLKILAAANFSSAARSRWNTDDFLEAAYEVFESTKDSDRGLRDVVVTVFRTHKDQLLRKKQAEDLLVDLRGLAVELLKDPARPSDVSIQQQNGYYQLPVQPGYAPYQPRRKRKAREKRGPYGFPSNGEDDPKLH